MTDTAIVLMSGGIDSTVAAYAARAGLYDIIGVGCFYHQRHRKELNAAGEIARHMDIRYHGIRLPNLGHSALTDPAIAIPDAPADDPANEAVVVPGRNAILLTAAIPIAIEHHAARIVFGAHLGDRLTFPDCSPAFVHAMTAAIRQGYGTNLTRSFLVWAPFLTKTKAEIITLGKELGVPFDLTWSCYRGAHIHCGTCAACLGRRGAFTEAEVEDPTRYQSGPDGTITE